MKHLLLPVIIILLPVSLWAQKTDYNNNSRYTDSSKMLTTAGYSGNKKHKKTNGKHYGDNVFAVTPLGGIIDDHVSAFSVGLSYEHISDPKGHVSFYLPVYICSKPGMGNTDVFNTRPFFYVMPGIKIYPVGNRGVLRYAIAAMGYIAMGKQQQDLYFMLGAPPDIHRYIIAGAALGNSVNYYPNPHLYMGMEFNIGLPISDGRLHNNEMIDVIKPLVIFAFNIGCRF